MSESSSCPHVVILGAGPAGCTLAGLLAQRGFAVVVCDDEKRPELLVGESLIPGVVPVFRQLGIEDRVAKMSTLKPGASFFTTGGHRLHFHFSTVERQLPGYSYNTPRPELDNLLRERAEELGARFVKIRAGVEPCRRDGEPALRLDDRSRDAIGLPPACEESPLLVDATGRARLFSRTLGLKAESGDRNDVAYFAHYENFVHDEVEPGQVIISVLTHGWGWRIPLPGRLSVGIVVNKEHAKTLGETPEERLENAIRNEPLLREKGRVRDDPPFAVQGNPQRAPAAGERKERPPRHAGDDLHQLPTADRTRPWPGMVACGRRLRIRRSDAVAGSVHVA